MVMRVPEDQTVIIIADPPWPHANGSRTNSGKSPKYALMNLAEIEALGNLVKEMAGDNAVLYLWSTGPHLPGAISTLRSWGFIYRSFHVWRKSRIACGFWVRSNAELVLVGERGRPSAPQGSFLIPSIFDGMPQVREHSSKPSAMHENAERLWPASRKIELFARSERSGWESYGSQLGYLLTPTGVDESYRAAPDAARTALAGVTAPSEVDGK